MYLEHYGLREAPFRITPHTEFFFAGGNRGATLEALVYAITHDEGIVKVSGEVGSGKTMLCRMLLEKLPATVETVYLANPSYSRNEILQALAAELQIEPPPASQGLKILQERLLQSYAANRRVVVLIDEAHAMPAETLEEIRLLSNLESSRHKLLQIVLFGQPELNERLAQANLRQLKERITHNFSLEPLRRTDIGPYLMFRLRAAGYHGPDLFSPKALQGIATASEGLTRRINILADKALLAAFAENTHLIGTAQVHAAVRDAQFTPLQDKALHPPRLGPLAALGLGLVLTTSAYWFGRQSIAAAPGNQGQATLAATGKAAAAEATPSPQEGTDPATSVSSPEAIGPLTRTALAATQDWLIRADRRHYVVQLLVANGPAARQVETYLAQSGRELLPEQLGAYRTRNGDKERWGVIYGDYPDRTSAQVAIEGFPERIRSSNPYPRKVQQLR